MLTSTGDIALELTHPTPSAEVCCDPKIIETEEGEKDEQNKGENMRSYVLNDFSLVTIRRVKRAKCNQCPKDYSMSICNPTITVKRYAEV